MNTLRQISEKEQSYHRYQPRVNYLRERMCLGAEWDQAIQQSTRARFGHAAGTGCHTEGASLPGEGLKKLGKDR